MAKLTQLPRQPAFQIFLSCLFFILINWPFLAIPGNSGLMSMFTYIFVLWGIFILLLFLIHKKLSGKAPDETGDAERGD